jgi:hypothetical protein
LGSGADIVRGGSNTGIAFPKSAWVNEDEAPLDVRVGPGMRSEANAYAGRVADAEVGLNTCVVMVARGVLPLNSLTPSSESMTVRLSKAGPFLNSGVVRSEHKSSIHRILNMN